MTQLRPVQTLMQTMRMCSMCMAFCAQISGSFSKAEPIDTAA